MSFRSLTEMGVPRPFYKTISEMETSHPETIPLTRHHRILLIRKQGKRTGNSSRRNLDMTLLEHPNDLYFGCFHIHRENSDDGGPQKVKMWYGVSQRSLSSFSGKFTKILKYRMSSKMRSIRLESILRDPSWQWGSKPDHKRDI